MMHLTAQSPTSSPAMASFTPISIGQNSVSTHIPKSEAPEPARGSASSFPLPKDSSHNSKVPYCLHSSNIGPIALWLGFVSGVLTIVLGVVFIITRNAYISWPSSFTDDLANQQTWRNRLFTFNPIVFIDTFTPIVMGIITIGLHLKPHRFVSIIQSYDRFFAWHLILALFGNLGYGGGLGIITGGITLLVVLVSFVAMWNCDGPASLNLIKEPEDSATYYSPGNVYKGRPKTGVEPERETQPFSTTSPCVINPPNTHIYATNGLEYSGPTI